MWRRKVFVVVAAGGVALAAFGLWHARASAQSECIWDCVANQVCFGPTELECWGCAPGKMNYNCDNQMGRKDWANQTTYGTGMGNKFVQYVGIPCVWKTRCGSRWYPDYSCDWVLGICTHEPPSFEGCTQCIILEGNIYEMLKYVNAYCYDCPSGN